MSENNKPKSREDYHKESLEKEEAKKNRMENNRKQIIERLTTDPEIQAYFSQFSKRSVEHFIDGYAFKMYLLLEYGEQQVSMAEKQDIKYVELAEKCLTQIQLKKLFDLYCQWDAELITLEGIEITADFHTVSLKVMNTELIPPISQEEFDLYYQYAQSDQFDYTEDDIEWIYCEDYRTAMLKNNDDNDNYFPAWFLYHNNHTGNHQYLILPNIRATKENVYRHLAYEKERLELEAQYESGELTRYIPDDKPDISDYSYSDIMAFMKRFEKPETVRLFEEYCKISDLGVAMEDPDDEQNNLLDERVQDILHYMNTRHRVIIPIEANDDWRKGLIAAWEKFEIKQIIAALPDAYEEYLFRLENKIAFPEEEDMVGYADIIKGKILRGRELKGEPRDFNF